MESNQNPENSREEYTPLDSRTLMNLANSQEIRLKERERLQVAVIEEKVGKLVGDLQNQFSNALVSIKHDFDLKSQKLEMTVDEMKRDNQKFREELKETKEALQKERAKAKTFAEMTTEAVKEDRKRLNNLESRSLWDWIRGK